MTRLVPLLTCLLLILPEAAMSQSETRVRARDLGVEVGIFQPGAWNAITDVSGVAVGHATVVEGDGVRTGVTAILPHPGNPYLSRVPAAIHVGNGFGKLLGVTQVRELGEMETPILLTCTLCVWKAADAMVAWMLEQEGMAQVRSLNAVVGETNDGGLNDIRARPVTPEHVRAALASAAPGPVAEGSVGAGTGTRAFGWKGGIGTSSRVLPVALGGYTVGVLVQSNFGGILTMGGAPVGQELGRYSFRGSVERPRGGDAGSQDAGAGDLPSAGDSWLDQEDTGQGSIMMVVATDAPLSARNLERLAARAIMGLARTGSFAGNGSGDYVIAFSTHPSVRRAPGEAAEAPGEVGNDGMSALFQAVVEATEESIYNSLLMATTVTGVDGNTAEALPIAETLAVLREYGVVR
ncbi:MAG TPA: P1 family peptidase [Longimicrobiales bacterium]|nr:P1 family peptidase [Longimicrobiales bacterium]